MQKSLLFSAVNSYLQTLCGILPEETCFFVGFKNFHFKGGGGGGVEVISCRNRRLYLNIAC